MPRYDQHLHSKHSFDSDAEPAGNVGAALEAGFDGLTFTEHFDVHPEDWDSCTYDDADYSRTISALRTEFGDAIHVGKGIEVCYQPDRMDFILDFLERHEFDLVMLSVHYFGPDAVHVRRNWNNIDVATGTRRYLETVREAAALCVKLHQRRGRRVFDVLGHLDLVKRYTTRWFATHLVGEFEPLIDEILVACLDADLVPEINTSTLRQGCDEPMPGPRTIRRYRELGGTGLSVGSDAHVSRDIGAGVPQATDLMRAAGFTRLAVHKARTCEYVTLE